MHLCVRCGLSCDCPRGGIDDDDVTQPIDCEHLVDGCGEVDDADDDANGQSNFDEAFPRETPWEDEL